MFCQFTEAACMHNLIKEIISSNFGIYISPFSKILARFQVICVKSEEEKFLPDIFAFCKSITKQGIFWVLLTRGTVISRYGISALNLNVFSLRDCHNLSNVYSFFRRKYNEKLGTEIKKQLGSFCKAGSYR